MRQSPIMIKEFNFLVPICRRHRLLTPIALMKISIAYIASMTQTARVSNEINRRYTVGSTFVESNIDEYAFNLLSLSLGEREREFH